MKKLLAMLAVVAGAMCLAAPATSPSLISSSAAGHWEGAIALPGLPLIIHIDLATKNDLWTGTIDIPQQHANHLALDPVTITASAVRFSIPGVPGDPTFDGKLADGKIAGQFKQGALTVPFTLGREPYVLVPAVHPPTTKTLLPYRDEQVGFENGAVHLAGTLTIPTGNGPFPAVIFITGSGPQNRDEELFGHKPFLVIADDLTRGGFATLRADDRGVGGSTGGPVSNFTTAELATDAQAALAFLKTRPEIAADRIGLLGHSEGAIIAPLIASQRKDIAFVIMLAGSGVPGDQILRKQSELLAQSRGESADDISRQSAAFQQAMKSIESNAPLTATHDAVRNLILTQLASVSTTQPGDGDASIELQTLAAMNQMTSPWFRFFLTYDPRPALRKLSVPVLVLAGDKDRQADPDQNLPEITKALAESGDKDVTIQKLPGLNHLFQTADTGSVQEYPLIQETISQSALTVIRQWLQKRFIHG
ncbi:MAG: alpha/beta fold hydrolase [Phycisphaerae bacterium]|nr:alpha/beta fold hydrolase [Phycisphaerae bacterium]